jgi:hypothetical protein
MTDTFRTMIVPAAHVDLARALGAGLSPGGAGMFTTGLSASGSEPATHFVSTGMIGERFAECIASGETLHVACTETGAAVTRAQCDALVTQSDVTEEEPFAAFARLGLVILGQAG